MYARFAQHTMLWSNYERARCSHWIECMKLALSLSGRTAVTDSSLSTPPPEDEDDGNQIFPIRNWIIIAVIIIIALSWQQCFRQQNGLMVSTNRRNANGVEKFINLFYYILCLPLCALAKAERLFAPCWWMAEKTLYWQDEQKDLSDINQKSQENS